jgi:hypothetical protein
MAERANVVPVLPGVLALILQTRAHKRPDNHPFAQVARF